MSAFEEAYGHIVASLTSSSGGQGRGVGIDALSAVLENYLAALAIDPALARVFLIEVYAAGQQAVERRLALQRGLVDALAGLLGASGPEDRFAVEAMVAAIVSMVTTRLAVGDVEGIRALHAPIIALAGRLGIGSPGPPGEL